MKSSRSFARLLRVVFVLLLLATSATAAELSRESVLRGQVLFGKRGCRNCHAVDGKAQALGPNLGLVEKKLTRRQALDAVVHPSREIRKGFESVVVVLSSGRVLSGRILRSDDSEVSLLVAKGSEVTSVTVPADDVDEVVTMETSIMPTDLLRQLKPPEVSSLLDYLQSVGLVDAESVLSNADMMKVLHSGNSDHQHGAATPPYSGPDTRPVFDEVDHDVTIEVVPKQMRYDVSLFDVRPGAKVKLTLKNPDEMQHNLFLCRQGATTWLDVAKATWALGAEGPQKRYTPDSPAILHHTRLVDPGSSDSIYFTAPQEEGVYPFVCTLPGHAFLMRGEMHVLSDSRGLHDVTWRYYEGSWDRLPDFESLTPVRAGTLEPDELPSIRRTAAGRRDNFGLVFDGTLSVLLEGDYRFLLDTDDGSRILINGETVIDYDGVHGDGTVRSGTVHLTPGDHELQLQFFEKEGGEVLLAGWSGPGFKMLPLSTDKKTLLRFEDEQFRLQPEEQPLVVRAGLPDASSRSIAVGLIGGVNCCFDAQTCQVVYGWNGDFLDIGPERGYGRQRGGGTAVPLGTRYEISGQEFPLRLGTADDAFVRFSGYRRSLLGPTFVYTIGDTQVEQTIESTRSSRGLLFRFRLRPIPDTAVTFSVSNPELQRQGSAGSWEDGVLTVPAANAGDFSLSLEPPLSADESP